MRARLQLIATLLIVSSGCKSAPPTDGYDVVILNGRVMDPETNFDEVRNVGIVGDRIIAITSSPISGAKTIDAAGHAVAPGFINTHSHSFAPFDQKMMAHDGTTTLLDTEAGVASAPLDSVTPGAACTRRSSAGRWFDSPSGPPTPATGVRTSWCSPTRSNGA
jgi:hypothetical protein